MFLFGGITFNNKTRAFVYTFNLWSVPNIPGDNIHNKFGTRGIVNYNGKMYLFGGCDNEFICLNDMFILDTINLSWEKEVKLMRQLQEDIMVQFYYQINTLFI